MNSTTIPNPVLAGTAQPDDEDAPLRPDRLAGFIGQTAQIERLSIALEAARISGEVLDHLLVSGPPGLGKTTIANIVHAETGGRLIRTNGAAIKKAHDLTGILLGLKRGDVLFIDEVHAISDKVAEFLYTALEDFRLDFILGEGSEASAVSVNLERFTLIGATTRKGMLTQPMQDRFGLDFVLDFYADADLARIVTRSAGVLGLMIEPDAALEVARRSRGTPRIANRLLRRVRDMMLVRGAPYVSRAIADEALKLAGIDQNGLDDLARRYLRTLKAQGGVAGLKAIAATMQEDETTLEDAVEPFLLHQGWIVRTPGGRRLADKTRGVYA